MLNIEAVWPSETSTSIYQSTERNRLEGLDRQTLLSAVCNCQILREDRELCVNFNWNWYILSISVFRLLRKIKKSVMSVCPSARYNSAPTGRIFIKFDMTFPKIFLRISSFMKIWQEYRVIYMKSNTYIYIYIYIYDHISLTSQNEKIFQTKVTENIQTRVSHSKTSFP